MQRMFSVGRLATIAGVLLASGCITLQSTSPTVVDCFEREAVLFTEGGTKIATPDGETFEVQERVSGYDGAWIRRDIMEKLLDAKFKRRGSD